MKYLYHATDSPNTFRIARLAFSRHSIYLVHAEGLYRDQTADDIRILAQQEAELAFRYVQKPIIATEYTLEIASLEGYPDIRPKEIIQKEGVDGLLRQLEGRLRPTATFKECIAYMDSKQRKPRCFYSEVRGTVSDTLRGRHRHHHLSPIVKIFKPENYQETIAEMNGEEYNAWASLHLRDTHLPHFAKWFLAHS